MSFQIRHLNPEEAHLFVQELSRLASDGLGFPEEALEYYRKGWTVDVMQQRARDCRQVLLAAWQGDRVVGLLQGTAPEGGIGTIIWVLVDGEHQHHGVGRQLFDEACRRYRDIGAHKVKLTVPSQDTVPFYERQGMQVEGIHRDHWWRMDFWAMGKVL